MSELKSKMPDEQGEKRLLACFDKTMAKIAKHQKADGNFDKNDALGVHPARTGTVHARGSTAGSARWGSPW